MGRHFWLRAESKENEFRRALTPQDCKKMLEHGHSITVEDWQDSIIPTQDYQAAGCSIAPAGSWVDAPSDTIIVGLKALPHDISTFNHTHIYFSHSYKEQDGWKELLGKFKAGGGKIIDLEYMVDERGRRVAAFGYWAGYVGASLGALFDYTDKEQVDQAVSELNRHQNFNRKEELIKFIEKFKPEQKRKAIIIGSLGRSGRGATEALTALGYQLTKWDIEETKKGGPFTEILDHHLFVNCVLAMHPMPPFITHDLLKENRVLNSISDVSCDPDSDCNMVPLYKVATTLEQPFHLIPSASGEIKLIAIDNLPSILPYESSTDFSTQLHPYLVNYDENHGPVAEALKQFNKFVNLV